MCQCANVLMCQCANVNNVNNVGKVAALDSWL